VIQRCQVHKKRNVTAHVPEQHHAELERPLRAAYHETDYATARGSWKGQLGGWSGSTMMRRQACVKASARL
jgi:transposase-like protein